MNIVDVRWFCGVTSVGIVRVKLEYEVGYVYYISAFEPSTEEADAQYIAEWGSTFDKRAGDVLFGVK